MVCQKWWIIRAAQKWYDWLQCFKLLYNSVYLANVAPFLWPVICINARGWHWLKTKSTPTWSSLLTGVGLASLLELFPNNVFFLSFSSDFSPSDRKLSLLEVWSTLPILEDWSTLPILEVWSTLQILEALRKSCDVLKIVSMQRARSSITC